jgi:ABC-type bacteriocin/lantibiotic exporter with double-glycine peptidase domain
LEKHYNHFMNADTLRLLLTGSLVAMFLLALLYLRRRPLTWIQLAAWGLIALLVPALGPFLVILSQPGKSNGTRRNAEVTEKSAFLRARPRPTPRKRSDLVRIRRKR